MYLRAVHADASISMLRQLIRDNPLGILTTAIPSKTYSLLQSTHLPWLLDVDDETDETHPGMLRGHIARSNPQSKAMIESLERQKTAQNVGETDANVLEEEVMVLFNSPVQHYVTPKFYTETKPSTGKVVPTWNYAAAAAYGRAKIYFNPDAEETIEYLTKQLDDLSRFAEESFMGYTGFDGNAGPWRVSDAPEKFISILSRTIVGIEIKIDRLEGKFKMSQEMRPGDRVGVVRGFESMGTDIGRQMADVVGQRGELKDFKVVNARAAR